MVPKSNINIVWSGLLSRYSKHVNDKNYIQNFLYNGAEILVRNNNGLVVNWSDTQMLKYYTLYCLI